MSGDITIGKTPRMHPLMSALNMTSFSSLAMTLLLNYSGTALAGNTFVTICQHLIYVRKVRTYFQRKNVSFAYSLDAEWSRAWWLQIFFNILGFSTVTLILPEHFSFLFRKKLGWGFFSV